MLAALKSFNYAGYVDGGDAGSMLSMPETSRERLEATQFKRGKRNAHEPEAKGKYH